MVKPQKIVLLIFLSIICISCASHKIDLEKLHDKNKKYGLVIFRPFYVYGLLSHVDLIIPDLTEDSVLSMIVRPMAVPLDSSCNLYSDDCYSVVCRQGTGSRHFLDSAIGKQIDEKLFINKEASKLFGHTVLNPEYFYVMLMLPEGQYRLSLNRYTSSLLGGIWSLSMPGLYSFNVKAGKINYIGDLLIGSTSIKKIGGGFFSELSYEHNLLSLGRDLYQHAQDFIKKFYPEVDLPFVKNIIKEVPKQNIRP